MSATATPRRPAAGQSTPKRPTRAHGAMALVLIALGAYPFLTGAYAERSLLWNSASVVLLLSGLFSLWIIWRAFSATRQRGR